MLNIQYSILNVQRNTKTAPGGVRFSGLAGIFTSALRIEDWILSIGFPLLPAAQ